MAKNPNGFTKFPKVKKLWEEYSSLKDERIPFDELYDDLRKLLSPSGGKDEGNESGADLTLEDIDAVDAINSLGEEAKEVLVSALQGGLTSSVRPWFSIRVPETLPEDQELKLWLEDATKILNEQLRLSGFYAQAASFYDTIVSFNTASMYCGGLDTGGPGKPSLHFDVLPTSSYVIAEGPTGTVDKLFRTIWMSPRQIRGKFGKKKIGHHIKQRIDSNQDIDKRDIKVIQAIYPVESKIHGYQSVYFTDLPASQGTTSGFTTFKVSGYKEFPFPTARWKKIPNAAYGRGPGLISRKDLLRLQQIEEGFLMGIHKALDPPINVPVNMKNKVNTLPGGRNYYGNINEQISETYSNRPDFGAIGLGAERVEHRIRKNFYNDVFLTATRDPNASPLRTGQVQAMENEKIARLAQPTERLLEEWLSPVLKRSFKVLRRSNVIPNPPPAYQDYLKSIDLVYISPLAQAQKLVESQSINNFLQFAAGAVQFDPMVRDIIDIDEAVRVQADVQGVPTKMIKPEEEVDKLRELRLQQQQAKEAQAQAMQQNQINTDQQLQEAQIASEYANVAESMPDVLNI